MKAKIYFLITFFLLLVVNSLLAQNVGINGTGASPDNSAMLDINSSNSGLLIPRVALTSSTDGTTVSSPATSLMIYNTNTASGLTPGYYYNSGTGASPVWVRLLTGNSTVTSVTATSPVYSSGGSAPNISLQGASGTICYGTGAGSNFNTAGTSGQYLQSAGTSAPVWATPKAMFSVQLNNGGNSVANGSATNSGPYVTWTSATAPGGNISNYTLLTGSFYQANSAVSFTKATGWIYTTSTTGTFAVTIYKYSGIAAGGCNAQVGTATSTGTLIGSCSVTAASATVYAGKFTIDVSASPISLAAGDVLVLFVQNTSGGSRTWYIAGNADFTANIQ